MQKTKYDRKKHSAAYTNEYVFHQLIPYIGNKRKLLDLIGSALAHIGMKAGATFLDLFAGSGVVSRYAKTLGFRVIANDWEPYSQTINTSYIRCNRAPVFQSLGGYQAAIEKLNSLPPRIDWVTEHLCPRDDDNYDIQVDRLFYMRKNGMRMDAIRHQIEQWKKTKVINDVEEACLLAPLLYQTCYNSNTSGVFKGFHNGWGGQTGTALYRIAADLRLSPVIFCDNGLDNVVTCRDAQQLAGETKTSEVEICYLDPPYNQHPYGSNYHVLNSVALWDKPELTKQISSRTKSAIRLDWRSERRSAYNHPGEAISAYRKLLGTLNARFILTSYSTDGNIRLEEMLAANAERGGVQLEMRQYKRYRVSSQRFSTKPVNVEFVIITDTQSRRKTSVDELMSAILTTEKQALSAHPEFR